MFPVAVPDSLPPRLRCFVEVRNRLDYPYSDLYVAIAHNLADSAAFRTDKLADRERSVGNIHREGARRVERFDVERTARNFGVAALLGHQKYDVVRARHLMRKLP